MKLRALLAGVGAAALAVSLPGHASAPERGPLGFAPGFEPLRGAVIDPEVADCGECHEDEEEELEGSRHQLAWTNTIFQAGFLVEQRAFCITCHVPRAEQVAEIRANQAWYRQQDPHLPQRGAPVAKRPEPEAAAGIDCLTCHVRDGAVLVAAPTEAAHATRVEPALATSEFCKGCHEFQTPRFVDGGMSMTDLPMQGTWSEWSAWVAAGAPRAARGRGPAPTCQSCHMPRGAHSFHGAHDLGTLRGSVDVRVELDGDLATWTLRSVDTGHSLPTGDLFRHLTLEVLEGGEWTVIDWIGRRFEIDEEGWQRLVSDTSLKPGEPRVVRHAPGPWRLRYHYGSERDEQRGLLGDEDLYAVLAQGRAPAPTGVR